MEGIFLTEDEVRELTRPLVRPSAQIKWLRDQGYTVQVRPDGSPCLARAHVEAMMGVELVHQTHAAAEPDWSKLDVPASLQSPKQKAA